MRRFIAVCIVVTALLGSPAQAKVDFGDRGDEVKKVQEHLKWFGYTIDTDGVFGWQTLRAVVHWQRAQGLTIDGIVGEETAESLGIATRRDQIQVTTPPAPPMPVFANACDEMSWYRQAAGLPAVFDQLGYRESRCDNTQVSRTNCCVGWWQNYISSHLSRASAYRERIINECGVTQRSDILGDTPEQKLRQACVTMVVYERSGLTPWAL